MREKKANACTNAHINITYIKLKRNALDNQIQILLIQVFMFVSFIYSFCSSIYFVFIGIRNPFSLRHLAFILFKYSHFFPCLFVFYFSLIVFIVKRKILFRDKIETYASFSNQMTGYINIIV